MVCDSDADDAEYRLLRSVIGVDFPFHIFHHAKFIQVIPIFIRSIF